MKTAVLVMAMSILGFTTQAQKTNNKNSATIVLVHGAWSDATAWQAVVPLLKAQGHEVIAVNLPGHGTDATSFASISLQSYVDAVKNAIGDRKNVILVGQSMAGLVISEVAEEIPGQIKELVYLAAYLPQNGESLLLLAKQDADSHVGKYLQIDQSTGSANIVKYVANNINPEPLAPLATPVTLTDGNFGSVKKVYIHTINDHAVSFTLQKAMVK